VSEIKTFFRFCPECGRRFHIKIVDKKLVDVKREVVEVRRSAAMMPITGNPASFPVMLQEGEPIVIDIEEFQYVYKCGHCGHEWTEKHIEEQKGS
jgi:DNA-directed RNA polymerase subunit RPC12/RpoP